MSEILYKRLVISDISTKCYILRVSQKFIKIHQGLSHFRLLFVKMLALVLICFFSISSARVCTTVNGVAGACDLLMNQFTFAGTHNSGVGAWGGVWHWSGIQASSCWYRSQDKSITEQMELGIRYTPTGPVNL